MHRMLLDLPAELHTERLLLRPYRAGDGDWYYPLSQRNQEHLHRYESDNPVMRIRCLEDAEVVVRQFATDWATCKRFFLGAFERDRGAFVAQVYGGPVSWELPEFEVGYFGDVAQGGCGYATEAVRGALALVFGYLGARRASLRCDDTNVRSYRLAERCGFRREGHIREDHPHPDGTLTGTLCYGLLRDENEATRRAGAQG
jgi:[ribosomal protein S5]-alanine N-acetyltransferase